MQSQKWKRIHILATASTTIPLFTSRVRAEENIRVQFSYQKTKQRLKAAIAAVVGTERLGWRLLPKGEEEEEEARSECHYVSIDRSHLPAVNSINRSSDRSV